MASYVTPPKTITPTRGLAQQPTRDDTVSIPRDPMQRSMKKVPANRNPGRFFSRRAKRGMATR